MTEHHGEIRGYDDMAAILRRVAELRNISREAIDELAGLPRGYAAKTLAEVPLRRLGPDTLGPMLGALGVKLTAHDDPEAMARYGARAADRKKRFARSGDTEKLIVLKFTRRHMRKLAKKAAAARRALPIKKRKAMTRNATRARWHKLNIKLTPGDLVPAARATGTSPAAVPASVSPPHHPTHTVDTAEL